MKIRNTQKVKVADADQEQFKDNSIQIGMLIVGGQHAIRQSLIELIGREHDIGNCIEADNVDQAFDAINKLQVDLAIIDILLKDTDGLKIVDKIKFQRPDLPIILLPMNSDMFHSENNPQTTKQIVKAIRYAQSLIRSQIFGFTLVVNLERNPQNDY